jgi:hypothetical protein
VISIMHKFDFRALLWAVFVFAFQSQSFSWKHSTRIFRTMRQESVFLKGTVGNDNSREISWNPAQASEFLTWHAEDPEKAGQQLAPMIRHWDGKDVGEFLTRMYLGEVNLEEYTISYHPSNVRNPQWLGLGEDGLRFLTLFFLKALPSTALMPKEISRFADYFLLKEHKWPATAEDGKSNEGKFDTESFGGRGHAADLARVFGYIRRERLGDFTAEDVVSMFALAEQEDKNRLILKLGDFFGNIGIQMTSMEKIMTVEGLALQGCSPGLIARLISSIEEIGENVRLASMERTKCLEEAQALLQKTSNSVEAVWSPSSEIISEGSESLGLMEFESRWLPEELLQDDTKVQ